MSVSFIVLVFLSVLGFFGTMQIHIVEHEDAHKQINKHNGCKNQTVNIGFMEGSVTCQEYDEDVSDVELDRARLLHGFNEVVGYNTSSIIAGMFFCTMLIVFSLFAFYGGRG